MYVFLNVSYCVRITALKCKYCIGWSYLEHFLPPMQKISLSEIWAFFTGLWCSLVTDGERGETKSCAQLAHSDEYILEKSCAPGPCQHTVHWWIYSSKVVQRVLATCTGKNIFERLCTWGLQTHNGKAILVKFWTRVLPTYTSKTIPEDYARLVNIQW